MEWGLPVKLLWRGSLPYRTVQYEYSTCRGDEAGRQVRIGLLARVLPTLPTEEIGAIGVVSYITCSVKTCCSLSMNWSKTSQLEIGE